LDDACCEQLTDDEKVEHDDEVVTSSAYDAMASIIIKFRFPFLTA
jgi:hypothetical protein